MKAPRLPSPAASGLAGDENTGVPLDAGAAAPLQHIELSPSLRSESRSTHLCGVCAIARAAGARPAAPTACHARFRACESVVVAGVAAFGARFFAEAPAVFFLSLRVFVQV